MARGGKRPGAGKPKGHKSEKTLEKIKVLEAFRQRTMRSADLLFDAQITLARGQTFLYKIEKEWIKTGSKRNGEDTGYWRNKKPKLVESQSEIEVFLETHTDKANGDIEDDNDPSSTYYFLTVKEPNNQALDSMLDRSLGKTAQAVTGPDGGAIVIQQITGMKVQKE